MKGFSCWRPCGEAIFPRVERETICVLKTEPKQGSFVCLRLYPCCSGMDPWAKWFCSNHKALKPRSSTYAMRFPPEQNTGLSPCAGSRNHFQAPEMDEGCMVAHQSGAFSTWGWRYLWECGMTLSEYVGLGPPNQICTEPAPNLAWGK